MRIFIVLSILLPEVFTNSESEKWSWPSSAKDQTHADSRKDIYYENINDNERAGRIRVPTSYYDNRRWRWTRIISRRSVKIFRRRWKTGEDSNEIFLILFHLSKCFLMQMTLRDINAFPFIRTQLQFESISLPNRLQESFINFSHCFEQNEKSWWRFFRIVQIKFQWSFVALN